MSIFSSTNKGSCKNPEYVKKGGGYYLTFVPRHYKSVDRELSVLRNVHLIVKELIGKLDNFLLLLFLGITPDQHLII